MLQDMAEGEKEFDAKQKSNSAFEGAKEIQRLERAAA